MASSDNSKSISSSHSIPFQPRHDAFQDMTAFSPPTDAWVIRYPTQSKKENLITPARVPEAEQLEDPCKRWIESSDPGQIKSNKSLGTDDHFKSAVCSKNLLNVCEKLMSKKEFTPKHSAEMDDADDFEELSLMNEKSRMDFYRKKHGNRRNSKSAPASPKLERKALPESSVASYNPYFTITKAQPTKESNISFLTSIFGITAAKPAEAKANLAQKFGSDKAEVMIGATESTSSDSTAQKTRKLTPKPHEYREMNIFSPTSM